MAKLLRRGIAILALAAFLGVLPETAVLNAAEPVTLADWLRLIYVTPDREVDRTAPGLAAATAPAPPVVLQTSSEQTPPKPTADRNRLPDTWIRHPSRRSRRRRRRRA